MTVELVEDWLIYPKSHFVILTNRLEKLGKVWKEYDQTLYSSVRIFTGVDE